MKIKNKTQKGAATLLLLAGASLPVHAQSLPAPNAERNAYFGDLHLHTTYSFDAFVFLATRVTPDDAYRFARGEAVPYLNDTIRRKEPLDFLAVTDHSENIGVLNELDNPNSEFSKSEIGKRIKAAGGKSFWEMVRIMSSGKALEGVDVKAPQTSAWQHEVEAANKNYIPGKFTTFIAYEWSSMPEGKYNLHRNVFFRGAAAPFPFSSTDSKKPEDLWTYLEKNRQNGTEAFSISHNANASGGLMYDWRDSDGKPIDEVYAQRRALNEPLTEISQGKGKSETHPLLSPDDEFANFEIFDHLLTSAEKSSVHGSYVRDAFGRGLWIEQATGANPYKFGVVGASDYHNGLSTSTEESYGGTLSGLDPLKLVQQTATTAKSLSDAGLSKDGQGILDTSPGSLTGVWAEQNTRESIYDALRRKETFATSGTRIKFRFFGGWDFGTDALKASDWTKAAYQRGVPMGGDLPAKPTAQGAPKFLVWAVKDPNAANLDRAQIVKVWLDNGHYQEKVFDVALSNQRRADPQTGKALAVGSTVDLKTATYKNTIGATELSTVWTDPQFDAKTPAVYYLRVLEIPTPRWSTILAIKQGKPLPHEAEATVQERGWSSPIWYRPVGN